MRQMSWVLYLLPYMLLGSLGVFDDTSLVSLPVGDVFLVVVLVAVCPVINDLSTLSQWL